MRPVRKGANHDLKAVLILTLFLFEGLILPFVNAKLFQIRLLKHEEGGVLDRDPPLKPDS